MSEDRIERDLAVLREERWDRGEHHERLRRELFRESRPRRRGLYAWIGALFGSGVLSGLAVAEVLPRWRVTLLGEDGPVEAVLAPLGDATGPPVGLLRSETGELYEVEHVGDRLVMRRVAGVVDSAREDD